jgi:hypothetical protein
MESYTLILLLFFGASDIPTKIEVARLPNAQQCIAMGDLYTKEKSNPILGGRNAKSISYLCINK